MRAVSTNKAQDHSKWGVSKSARYRIFEAEFGIKMAEKYSRVVSDIREFFDAEIHCIAFEFKFFFSCETKSGRLHKRAGDTTNGIKCTEDALFNYLGVDDSFVIDARSLKIHSPKEKIEIDLWIKEYVRI